MKTFVDIDKDYGIDIHDSSGVLLVGLPGSGKTVFMTYLLLKLMCLGALVFIIDNKRSDLSGWKNYLHFGQKRVAETPNQVCAILKNLTQIMNKRYETHNNIYGGDFVDYGLPPIVVAIDEYSSVILEAQGMKDGKISLQKKIEGYLKQLVLKGRQMGVFTILGSQRLNYQTIDLNVSSEFSYRVAMGNLDPVSMKLAFPGCSTDELPLINSNLINGQKNYSGLIYSDRYNTPVPQTFQMPDMTDVIHEIPSIARDLDHNIFEKGFAESYLHF